MTYLSRQEPKPLHSTSHLSQGKHPLNVYMYAIEFIDIYIYIFIYVYMNITYRIYIYLYIIWVSRNFRWIRKDPSSTAFTSMELALGATWSPRCVTRRRPSSRCWMPLAGDLVKGFHGWKFFREGFFELEAWVLPIQDFLGMRNELSMSIDCWEFYSQVWCMIYPTHRMLLQCLRP